MWIGSDIESGCAIAPRHYPQRPCRADELSFALGQIGEIGLTHGGQEASLELRTRGEQACTVSGQPRLQVFDSTGHVITQASFRATMVAETLAVLPGPVLLLPHSTGVHGRAVALAEYSATQDDFYSNPSDCRGRARPIRAISLALAAIGFEERIEQPIASGPLSNPGLSACGFTYFITPLIPEDGPRAAP